MVNEHRNDRATTHNMVSHKTCTTSLWAAQIKEMLSAIKRKLMVIPGQMSLLWGPALALHPSAKRELGLTLRPLVTLVVVSTRALWIVKCTLRSWKSTFFFTFPDSFLTATQYYTQNKTIFLRSSYWRALVFRFGFLAHRELAITDIN